MSSNEDRQAVTLEEAQSDDNSDPESHEEAIREKQEETEEEEEHLVGMPNFAQETEGPEPKEDIRDAADTDTVSISSPDWLSKTDRRRSPSPDQRRSPGTPNLGSIDLGQLGEMLNQSSVSVGDIDPDNLDNVSFGDADIDIDSLLSGINLDNVSPGEGALIRLLSALLQFQTNQFQVMNVLTRLQLATSVGIADLIDIESPLSNITVSGSNTISDANSPEPVVPDSDQGNISTNTLFIKADEKNTDPIFIGDDEVDPSSGYVLRRGEDEMIETDLRGEELYMASSQSGQIIHILGMI